MWNLTETWRYEVWKDDGIVKTSKFLRQEGNTLIFSDFEIDTITIKAIRRV